LGYVTVPKRILSYEYAALLLYVEYWQDKSTVFWVVMLCSRESPEAPSKLHGVTTQKTILFAVTTARASNPKY
jgi:hypothetical protein